MQVSDHAFSILSHIPLLNGKRVQLLPLTMKRQLLSNCQKAVFDFRYSLQLQSQQLYDNILAKSFCFQDACPYYTKILTGIVSELVEILSSSTTTYFSKSSTLRCLRMEENSHNSGKPPPHTVYLRLLPSPTPRTYPQSLASEFSLTQVLRAVCTNEASPLHISPTEEQKWRTKYLQPKGTQTTYRKTKQEPSTCWEKLAAKLQENLKG